MTTVSCRSLCPCILALALVAVLASVAAQQPPRPKEIIPSLRPYAVSGVVVDKEGNPVGSVDIVFVSADDGKKVAVAVTDTQGRFLQEGLAVNQNGYRLIPAKSSYEFNPKAVTVTGPTSVRFVMNK